MGKICYDSIIYGSNSIVILFIHKNKLLQLFSQFIHNVQDLYFHGK